MTFGVSGVGGAISQTAAKFRAEPTRMNVLWLVPTARRSNCAGPQSSSLEPHTEMAAAIAEALGRQVAYVDVPPQAFAGALGAAGVPPWQVDGSIEDYAHYARGEAAALPPGLSLCSSWA